MTRRSESARTSLPLKLLALLALAICLALGLVGLVLPVIPGIVFLGIAALLTVKHFPSATRRMRRHPALGRHFERVEAFGDLSLADQARAGGWLGLRALLGGLAALGSLAARIGATRPAGRPRRS